MSTIALCAAVEPCLLDEEDFMSLKRMRNGTRTGSHVGSEMRWEQRQGDRLDGISEIHVGHDECLKLVCLELDKSFVFISLMVA